MKRLLVSLLLSFPLVFAACPNDGGTGGGNGGDGGNETTGVVFDNTAGSCPVSIYETNGRTDDVKIAEVGVGAVSVTIPWRANPGGYTFYLAYSVFIEDVPVTYIPKPGADQLVYRIDANIVNTITLPPIDSTVDSVDTPLSDAAYIVLKNTSYSSCYLLRGSVTITPDNVPDSHIVNRSEKALYRFSAPGAPADYRVFANAKGGTVNFSGMEDNFAGGNIYTFVFSGENVGELDLSLTSNTEIKLANVSMSQGLNGQYSFTTWRDKKTDSETGETVTGDNAIIFYANSAKLIGAYWQHPAGDFNYNGQILESEFREGLNGIAIWTLKSERTGYLLQIQADQTIQVSSASSPHPFYKQ